MAIEGVFSYSPALQGTTSKKTLLMRSGICHAEPVVAFFTLNLNLKAANSSILEIASLSNRRWPLPVPFCCAV